MATPPRVTRAQADDAIERITERRHKVDDANLHMLTSEPAEVLNYLRRYGADPYRHLPAHEAQQLREQDVMDGLLLRVWLWWEGNGAERWLLDEAGRLGMRNRRVGAPLGITSRQGIPDRRDRLRTLFSLHRVPDEKIARAERASLRSPEPQWRARHADAVLNISSVLLDHQGKFRDHEMISYWLDWLADPVDPPSPGERPKTGYVVAWCRAIETITALGVADGVPADSPLGVALQQGRSLAAEYRKITKSGKQPRS
jgi:hypothetical protein